MHVTNQVMAAFNIAQTQFPELSSAWIKISHEVGSRLPHSLLSVNIQRDGLVDLLLRCMEQEEAQILGKGNFGFHYQKIMSDYWVGSMYESFRLLRQRKLADSSPSFAKILSDLELIRMPLEKFEIAKDWKLQGALEMVRNPRNNDRTDKYLYDPKDPQRAHIMPIGVSSRGSIMWHVINIESKTDHWIERLDLADRIVTLWRDSTSNKHSEPVGAVDSTVADK